MDTKRTLKKLIPPIAIDAFRMMQNAIAPSMAQWQYMPDGWASTVQVSGWSAESIADAEARKWDAFNQLLEGTAPFGINHEDLKPSNEQTSMHNTMMSFGYVLGLAALGRNRLSVLDWGGGLGHYYLFARKLFPDLALDYHCCDLDAFCDRGRALLPDVVFHSDDRWKSRKFDLVFSSSSLQYVREWKDVLGGLSAAASSYLYITRIPMAAAAASFVVMQRPYALEYASEYLGWVFNQSEFLAANASYGSRLLREFVVMETPVIANAPEQPQYRGFLFGR